MADSGCDTIEAYLGSLTFTEELINEYGGLLSYWTAQLEKRPRVARMALDYLTAPGRFMSPMLYFCFLTLVSHAASSVDAERAFSGGRLMISHLQHQMSSRTFQAQMAIGSWFETPLLPGLSDVSRILEKHM